MRIPVTWPPIVLEFPGRGDSYSDCFCAALADAGARVVNARLSFRWLYKRLHAADFAHFHWPSFHYGDRSAPAALAKALLFACMLVWMRMSGVRILWTAHNLYPHERSSPPLLDYAVRRLIVCLAYRVFVHGTTAAAILQSELRVGSGKLVPIVHGNFLHYYPMQATRDEARRRIGVEADKPVFAFVGNCRRYKNVTALIATFQRVFDEGWLVIAGRCADARYRAEIEAQIRAKPERIVFEPRYVDDTEMQYFVRAADAVVLPFKDVLTSGTAILALSFGRPVVAPGLGNLLEVVHRDVGILYQPDDPDGLAHGMRAALARRFDQDAIARYVASMRWQDAAETVLGALRGAT